MITLTFIGSDRYAVGEYARDITTKLANLYEVKEEEILFLAPEYYLYHKGVEQTSYQVLIQVEANEKYRYFEKKVAEFLLQTAQEFMVHICLRFRYFKEQEYQHISSDYPRYITEENEVLAEEEEYDENTEIYEGNIFENFEEKWKEAHEHDHDSDACCHHHHHEDE